MTTGKMALLVGKHSQENNMAIKEKCKFKETGTVVLLKRSGWKASWNGDGDYVTITLWDVDNDCEVKSYITESCRNAKNWNMFHEASLETGETVLVTGAFKYKRSLTIDGFPNINLDSKHESVEKFTFDQVYAFAKHIGEL